MTKSKSKFKMYADLILEYFPSWKKKSKVFRLLSSMCVCIHVYVHLPVPFQKDNSLCHCVNMVQNGQ